MACMDVMYQVERYLLHRAMANLPVLEETIFTFVVDPAMETMRVPRKNMILRMEDHLFPADVHSILA